MATYKEKWGFPMCAGAIDGTHVPIKVPSQNHTDYVNRKSYYSIIMQALVDSRYLYRDIVVGWSGSVHDARRFPRFSKRTDMKVEDVIHLVAASCIL
ncbi:unnamed protein product [Pocillopora meandrina]|uniref:DDE Tnp4 domain-containing protein n=1 Tax=Pocillopora meandrina TaxID=46732 RepID=A0AAU9W6K9_9CNID|nr:unnamed protein product [Pocillopora meandrina]